MRRVRVGRMGLRWRCIHELGGRMEGVRCECSIFRVVWGVDVVLSAQGDDGKATECASC
jgi:hypothetical protein